jgi:hypothetical protein
MIRKHYNLYLWKNRSPIYLQPGLHRGRCVFTADTYKALVAEAQRRTVAAGYPKSRWMDFFDWNEGAR